MRIRSLSPLSRLSLPAWAGSLVAFMLLCGITAWWAVQLLAPRAPIATAAEASARTALPDLRLAGQLFGNAPTAADAAPAGPSNIEVLGVLAAGYRGSAILAIDGQPARAFAVGEQITATQRLLEVRGNSVLIDDGQLRQEISAPARPSLSILSSADGAKDLQTGFNAPSGPRVAAPIGGSSGPGVAAPRASPARAFSPSGLQPGAVAMPGIVPVHPRPSDGD